MESVQINPIGNFDSWESSKLLELRQHQISECLGQKVLFENANIRLWEVVLLTNERLPFRKSNRDCCWICMTNALAISRIENGQINLMRLKKGDTTYWQSENEQTIFDLENIGEEILVFHIMEFREIENTREPYKNKL